MLSPIQLGSVATRIAFEALRAAHTRSVNAASNDTNRVPSTALFVNTNGDWSFSNGGDATYQARIFLTWENTPSVDELAIAIVAAFVARDHPTNRVRQLIAESERLGVYDLPEHDAREFVRSPGTIARLKKAAIAISDGAIDD